MVHYSVALKCKPGRRRHKLVTRLVDGISAPRRPQVHSSFLVAALSACKQKPCCRQDHHCRWWWTSCTGLTCLMGVEPRVSAHLGRLGTDAGLTRMRTTFAAAWLATGCGDFLRVHHRISSGARLQVEKEVARRRALAAVRISLAAVRGTVQRTSLHGQKPSRTGSGS